MLISYFVNFSDVLSVNVFFRDKRNLRILKNEAKKDYQINQIRHRTV